MLLQIASKRHAFSVLLISGWVTAPAQAGLMVGHVVDKNGQSTADAVIFAKPLNAPPPPAKSDATAVVAQEKTTFVPYVTVIRSGTSIRFPNRDPYDHHVKSFSTAKTFEFRTDSKKEEPPITFDKAGEIALTCFFHSWMRGYIYVVDTPYFSKTDKSGNAVLNDLPPGKYEVNAWAPNMIGPPLTQTIQVNNEGSSNVKFKLDFVPKPAPEQKNLAKGASDLKY